MEKRFQSLRGYGRLPAGREHRDQPLTDQQIASVILGLAVPTPGWAGHASVILERRFPVGDTTRAFGQSETLLDAITKILSDNAFRKSLILLRLSASEGGVNSHGYATIVHDYDGERRFTRYVPSEAVSLLQTGADASHDMDQQYAACSQEVTFNRQFFDRLSQRIDRDRAHPIPLPEESPEYDEEEAERARRAKLGALPSSRYLNIGVDNQVTWPRHETLINFDRYTLVLLPKTKEHVQSISIDLTANKLNPEKALTIINRFLSLLTWCDDQFAIAQFGWSGNPVPVAVSKRDLAFTTTLNWMFDREIPASDEACRALALYREARNAEQNYMVSYAVLNYYKIIELRHVGWKASTKWVADNLSPILSDPNDRHGIEAFLKACGSEAPEMYIYAACRVAVAHASLDRVSDPDDAHEQRRLHIAADVMRRLSRRFISLELGVSDSAYSDFA